MKLSINYINKLVDLYTHKEDIFFSDKSEIPYFFNSEYALPKGCSYNPRMQSDDYNCHKSYRIIKAIKSTRLHTTVVALPDSEFIVLASETRKANLELHIINEDEVADDLFIRALKPNELDRYINEHLGVFLFAYFQHLHALDYIEENEEEIS